MSYDLGPNVTGELVGTTLTISGTGDMYNFSSGSSPFYYEDFIHEVIIESGVTSVGDYVFYQTYNLQTVTLGQDVHIIGERAFSYSHSLNTINFNNTLTTIGDYAFLGDEYLLSVNIPDSVNNIGKYAFALCDRLNNVILPDGLTIIRDGVFYKNYQLTTIVLPESVTEIRYRAFYDSGVSSIVMDKIEKIGEEAFYNCKFTTLVMPSTLTTISGRAFLFCRDLTSITLNSGLLAIGEEAFFQSSISGVINIPSSVNLIRPKAFGKINDLTYIQVNENNLYYEDINGVLFEKVNTSGGKTLLQVPRQTVLTGHYNVPNEVTLIEEGAFWMVGFSSICINEGCLTIREYAFEGNGSLESIIISSTVSEINFGAWFECNSLNNIVNRYEGNQTIEANLFPSYGTEGIAYVSSLNTNFINRLPDTWEIRNLEQYNRQSNRNINYKMSSGDWQRVRKIKRIE